MSLFAALVLSATVYHWFFIERNPDSTENEIEASTKQAQAASEEMSSESSDVTSSEQPISEENNNEADVTAFS